MYLCIIFPLLEGHALIKEKVSFDPVDMITISFSA